MIIDTHVHIGGEKVGFDMTEEKVLSAIKKYNIDLTIVSNGDAVEVDHEQKLLPIKYHVSQEDALRRVLEFARKYPEKIRVGVWVKPLTETVTDELKQLIADNRDIICALKLHPFHSKVSPVDKRTLPYLELANQYKLAVVSHTGTGPEDSPVHVYEAAKLFPEIPFVMVHMGLGSDNKEALELLGKADNLYGDTAWVPMETTIEAIRRYGSKKMLFGSDMPIDGVDTYLCNPKGERSMYQDYFQVLPEKISKEAYEDLMWRNALKVFKLNHDLIYDAVR
ncbi:MAG: amidohydrolase family protein [Lachnospiraceae bacterium]|nr:amidohydrolase family protein [Lachnospiraceae bacterium]